MRGPILLCLLSGCLEIPEPSVPMDASIMDASDASFADASIRDASADASMRVDARVTPRDAAPEASIIDAALPDAAMMLDAGVLDASIRLDASAPVALIMISEFRTRGPNGANDEFVEIVNASAATLDVSGFKLRAASASGVVGTRAVVPTGIVLAPGEALLFANSGASGYSGTTAPDVTYTFGLADECGIGIASPTGEVLDSVGTLTASTLVEGTPRMPLTESVDRSHARRRAPSGALVDTQDNASDFETIMPSTPTGRSLAGH